MQELAVARGEGAILAIQQELACLKQQLDARNRELFGASSEKRPRDRSGDGAGNGAASERTGHGPRDQPELPIVDVVHVLDDADRPCPKCGGDLKPWAGHFEDGEELGGGAGGRDAVAAARQARLDEVLRVVRGV